MLLLLLALVPAQDKIYHGGFGYIASDIYYSIWGYKESSMFTRVTKPLMVNLFIATVKEDIDYARGGKFDGGDIIATGIGTGINIILNEIMLHKCRRMEVRCSMKNFGSEKSLQYGIVLALSL